SLAAQSSTAAGAAATRAEDAAKRAEDIADVISLEDASLTKKGRHCCKVSDEAAFCLIQRPYISKTLLT
ncbi:hypothetical protein GFK33_27220, partial [Salmonella enterica subsp. enterica serovar 4,[5],12:i:-]|uniref:hypothetical protein n=1 Tax=Salmonella enterica TaxID=28901 RepID=UPI0013F023A4|nr:hypothetical protein [Salmonella enterica subsp. enterica serovar 4,[5],12:i:-]